MTMTMHTVPGAVPCKQPTTALGRHCAPGAAVGFCQKATCMAKCSVTLMRCRAHGQGRARPSLGADNTPDGPDALTCDSAAAYLAFVRSLLQLPLLLSGRLAWAIGCLDPSLCCRPAPLLFCCPALPVSAVGCSAGAQGVVPVRARNSCSCQS